MSGRVWAVLLGCLATTGVPGSLAQEASSRFTGRSERHQVSTPLADLPLAFVENRGQWDTPARFVARRGGVVARIEKDAIVLQLTRRVGDDRIEAVVVRLRFEGALETVALEGEARQSGISNFFLGNDPSRWRTEVPGYASVLYRGLREGADLRVREQEGRLEYDLILAPGADLEPIAVRGEGIDGIEVEPDGSLAMRTALGPIRHSRPVAWQTLAGGERAPIRARFRRLGPDRFGFEAPGRDPSLDLVIDPGISYSTFLGGASHEFASTLALDASGAATVAGGTVSSGFPSTAGAYDTSFNGGSIDGDAFVARLSPAGGSLDYSTFLGGTGDEVAWELALDASGAATLTGHTTSSDFPTTAGAYDTSYGVRGGDAFVARLSPSGGALVYSTYLGGGGFVGNESAFALALDASGAATVAGRTPSSDFPATAGAYDTSYNGLGDAFVARLSPSGGSLVYSTFLGGANGTGGETVYALALDATGAATVAGETTSSDFPTTTGSYDTSFGGGFDAFVARLSPSGGSLLSSTFLGAAGGESARALALDASGAATVAGYTTSSGFPATAGAYDTTFGGFVDAFVARLSASGGGLVYSTYLGGTFPDVASALSLDGSGAIAVAGTTGSLAFPTTAGAYDTSHNGGVGDAFVARLSPSGGTLLYSTFLGGVESEGAEALALDATGAAAVAGGTGSSDFPATAGAYDTSFNGPVDGSDAFVARLDLLPAGASAYGASTPGCAGPLAIGVTSWPQAGNASFAITCTNGPASAPGFLAVSGGGLLTPLVVAGVSIWVDPSAPLFIALVVPSNALGAAEVPLPIPPNPALAGAQVFCQFAWPDGCAPGGISASNALAIVVQP